MSSERSIPFILRAGRRGLRERAPRQRSDGRPVPDSPNSASRERARRIAFPLLALAIGVALAVTLQLTRHRPIPVTPALVVPTVEVVMAQPQSLRLTVEANGTVTPKVESDLVAEVQGRVVEVAPELVAGGFFQEGAVLLRLDDREHRAAVAEARATLALRESEAELARADTARIEALAARGVASEAQLDEQRSRAGVAAAASAEARARVARHRIDLERTVVRAPFDGRVRERSVDLGQFVRSGSRVGRIYATETAEVRLPIRIDELDLLGALAPGSAAARADLAISLHATIGSRLVRWPARLDRIEGDVDARTRLIHLVAAVDDPFARSASSAEREVLPMGLFVEARIEGARREGLVAIPPMALREADRVFVLGAADRLEIRDVGVIQRGRDGALIERGLEAGDRVIVSPLRVFSEGMALRTAGDAG